MRAPAAQINHAELSFNKYQILSGDANTLADIDHARMSRLDRAHAAQGVAAFESLRSVAIAHEAGHSILYAHHGFEVCKTKVWKQNRGVMRGQWTGETVAGGKWCVNQSTAPQQDFKIASILIAGGFSEIMFDFENIRAGSSVDELITGQTIAQTIAGKLGREPEEVWWQIITATGDVLKQNTDVIKNISRELDRR